MDKQKSIDTAWQAREIRHICCCGSAALLSCTQSRHLNPNGGVRHEAGNEGGHYRDGLLDPLSSKLTATQKSGTEQGKGKVFHHAGALEGTLLSDGAKCILSHCKSQFMPWWS
ncbi:hypothetical protein MHYP_G00171780 [Metynnis hypsauchen]